ncbi:pseudouridine synthase [Sediminibacterium sp.]|uniref:pseudouridine synthase n=1 Tax=Sediminibacterium sp. TaxID=1917865 RepID=UPI002725B39E|nr:pseudouridine synthase [Sediminibacterium sp.]MDO8996314.1 pseudouridine synthase [Sediminibacterium sp.]MDO9157622.1 pseudouridine synthase [Sediminibacterium sp.]MDP2420054.1 pseudouridine synthase [Sediminibacterium sp.]
MQKRTDNFSKFAEKKKGAAIKEAYRQEKRKNKADARAAGEEMRARKKAKARGEEYIDPKKVSAPQREAASDKPTSRAGRPVTAAKGPGRPTAGAGRTAAAGSEKPAAGSYKAFKNEKGGSQSNKAGKPVKATYPGNPMDADKKDATTRESLIPLNKYVAHSGVCGRREAAELVKEGKVTVNGDKIFEPGYKVSQADKILVKGKPIFLQRNSVYILLNKPKDYLTTASDPQGRKTVLDLIKSATPERVYPVGRLDRNTTGVLLLTNDGELAQKLTHPSFEVKKIYEVTLDKPVTKKDLDSIVSGITLEDGFVAADSVGYADSKSKNVVGIEIHSGRNRIVRRIFEHLGYDVKALDRVMFANLTKKNVERSKWRFLNDKEVRLLKFMNKSFLRKNKSEANA